MLKGDRSAGDEVHLKGIPDRGRVLLFAQAGGAKPIAATGMDDGCLASACGWVGGVYPSAPLKARTMASDGHCAYTRAARQRRAQVCGDSTVKSDGRWAGSPHPPQAVPLPRKKSGEWSWRPTGEVTLQLRRRIVLPLEGKGDRSAVDEVNCTPAPLREAFCASIDY